MSEAAVMPGAEPFSAKESANGAGALVLHGFTGTPQSMRGLAHAFAAAGFATELPLLPGHGTTVAEMARTDWRDWSAAADAAYLDLAARCTKVVVAGLSMGATLAMWLAERHPEIAGVISVNGAIAAGDEIDVLRDALRQVLDTGTEFMTGPGNDIADPDQQELAYEEAPVAAMASLLDALADIEKNAGKIACPLLLMVAPQDHVVPPASTDLLADAVDVPVKRIELTRSFHVATLDYDRELIEREAVAFALAVTSAAAP